VTLTEARVRELAREEIRAAASKPVAGEWTEDNPFGDKAWRRLIDGRTMLIVDNWRPNIGCAWRVFQRDGKLTMSGAEFASNGGDAYQNARDAADAWARDNAHLLDWTLPPAPVQPVAPRESDAQRFERLYGEQLNYGIKLQRIIEAFARGDELPYPDLHHHRILAEIRARPPAVPQPAPSATVDEVYAALMRKDGRGIGHYALRRALSTLSPAQLRGMVDAIGGGK